MRQSDDHLSAPGPHEIQAGGLRHDSEALTCSWSHQHHPARYSTGFLPTQSSGVSANVSLSPLILTRRRVRVEATQKISGWGGVEVRAEASSASKVPSSLLSCAERKTTSPAHPPGWPCACLSCAASAAGWEPQTVASPPRAHPPKDTASPVGSWCRRRTSGICLMA